MTAPGPRTAPAAEVALAVVTLVTALGFGRLFADAGGVGAIAAVAAVAHVLAAALRRTALPALAVAAVAAGAGVVATSFAVYPSTAVVVLPGGATLDLARADLSTAWDQFGTVVAPTPALPGFVLAAAAGTWLVAWLADWAAFRVGMTVEAVLPTAALFLFSSVLGPDRHRLAASAGWALAVLVFVAAHRAARNAVATSWVGGRSVAGRRASFAAGSLVALLAVAAGAVVGPRLPGAGSAGIVDWRGGSAGPGTRVTISPLVDIRSRLVEQSDSVVFRVQADQPAYWRLTSLDRFDGSVWTSSGDYGEAEGRLPSAAPREGDTILTQEVDVLNLAALWLPAAFDPAEITTDGTDVRWDRRSSTLIVDRDSPSSDGISYRVVSEVPEVDLDEVDRQGGPLPVWLQEGYLDLPADFPDDARFLARAITAGAQNPYRRARALQDYFREGFTYDLTVAPGHGDQAITAFLQARRGYCEQFAGAFAAMARVVGLPSRVAVGFTPGERDPADPDRYTVRGKHAHAWPEVWIDQVGWVAFEPTPGRGAPGNESYTGADPAQEGGAAEPASTTTAPPTTSGLPTLPSTLPESGDDRLRATAAPPAGGSGPSGPTTFALLLGAAAIGGAAWVGGVAAWRAVRRTRRRARADSPAERIDVAWAEGTEALALLAPPWSPTETHREFARRVRDMVGDASAAVDRLARMATVSAWSPHVPPEGAVDEARVLSDEIERRVAAQVDRRRRWRHRLGLRVR